MNKLPKQICKYQHFIGGNCYRCIVNAGEGILFKCDYTEADIKITKSPSGGYSFIVQKPPQPSFNGICPNFEIIPSIKEGLIKKLVKDLENP